MAAIVFGAIVFGGDCLWGQVSGGDCRGAIVMGANVLEPIYPHPVCSLKNVTKNIGMSQHHIKRYVCETSELKTHE